MKEKECITILEKLISLPSFKDGREYEKPVTDYLISFVAKELPWLKIFQQRVDENRINLFISDYYPTKLLIINHQDTVMPTSNWSMNPFTPKVVGDKIYGLGSSDTKGNIAALLSSLKKIGPTKGLGILLYIDEEYDFAGMKEYCSSDLARLINPQYVVSIDGSAMQLGLGCRGVIEVEVSLKGKTGHSADQASGVNVIRQFQLLMNDLEKFVNNYSSKGLGDSTFNCAKLIAGTLDSEGNLMNRANVIPDYLQALLEVRVASELLDAELFIDQIRMLASKYKLEVVEEKVNHNLKPLETEFEKIKFIFDELKKVNNKIETLDLSKFGYLDVQMLADVYKDAKIFSIGCGQPGQSHKADEYNLVSNIIDGEKIFKSIINFIL